MNDNNFKWDMTEKRRKKPTNGKVRFFYSEEQVYSLDYKNLVITKYYSTSGDKDLHS